MLGPHCGRWLPPDRARPPVALSRHSVRLLSALKTPTSLNIHVPLRQRNANSGMRKLLVARQKRRGYPEVAASGVRKRREFLAAHQSVPMIGQTPKL